VFLSNSEEWLEKVERRGGGGSGNGEGIGRGKLGSPNIHFRGQGYMVMNLKSQKRGGEGGVYEERKKNR